MTTRRDQDGVYDPHGPILHKDVGKRLDAIVRRHGGKPKPDSTPPGKVVLPSPGKRTCKDQLPLTATFADQLRAARGEDGEP